MNNNDRTTTRQAGFSLIELMVAMVVALILLAGILQILLGNRESFDTQKAMAGLGENARLASFVMDNAVAHAGYRVELEPELKYIFRNGFIRATDGGGTNADTLGISIQASGGVKDCGGTPIGNGSPTLSNFQLSVDATGELQCAIFDASGGVSQTWTLISNVVTFQARYGLDTDKDDAVDSYTDALTLAQSREVRSVRLQMLLASDGNVLPSPTSQSFKFADGQSLTVNDRRAYQMVDQTIALRNLLP